MIEKKKSGNKRRNLGRPVEKLCEQCGNESFIPKYKKSWHCNYCGWINGINGMKE